MRSGFLLAALVALPCVAQPVLVADINAGSASGRVTELAVFDGDVYFSAKAAGGTELWRFDPDTETAERVTNLIGESLKPTYLTDVDGVLFFQGSDATHGRELWSYDPVSNAYGLVADIASGTDSSTPNFLAAFDGDLYFRAVTPGSLKELWRHDPGAGTTVQTPEIRDPGSSGPIELIGFDGQLYFRAYDDPVGDELWRYDPVTNTNTLAADIVPGPPNSEPRAPLVLDGLLYFFARSPGNGPWEQLWAFDPVADTASKVADLPPGSGPDWASGGLVEVGGALYFFAGSADGADDLWRYDPGTGTAILEADLPSGSDARSPEILGAIAGVLYFAASADADGRELWQHDTASGVTSRVADLAPGAGSSDPEWGIVHDDALYFSADDGANGRELWRYQPPYLLTGVEGFRTLALPVADLPLGGRGPGFLTNLWTAGYKGADRDQRNRRGLATVFLYEEATAAFVPPLRETSVSPGQGMWVYVYEDDDPTTASLQGGFPKRLRTEGGTPVTGPFTFPITRTATSPTPGFNLVGNPYDDAIDWDDPSWTKTDVAPTVYVYDPNYNGGDYRTWDGTTGDLENGIIAAGQAFTVEALSSGAVLTVTESAKTGGAGSIRGKVPTPSLSLRLVGTVDGQARETAAFLTFREGAALGTDPLDARRLEGAPGASAFRLYTVAGTDAFALAALPRDLVGETEIPLYAEAVGASEARATLVWGDATLPTGWTATLEDRQTGATHDLTTPGSVSLRLRAEAARLPNGPPLPRALEVSASKAGSARFMLVLTPADQDASGALAFTVGEARPNPTHGSARLAVTLAEAGAVTLRVYDALGREVVSSRTESPAVTVQLVVPVGDLAPGAYVVRVEAPGGTAVRRLTVVR
ncbi:MAG: T9SS type A sorting domain-containing protein [Bacteroidota bacterium]